MIAASSKPVRCAIYTRVSTEQGLEQEFNSLDAQYDAAQAYIRSQCHAGWTLLRGKYDDGGFSGGNTERPALSVTPDPQWSFGGKLACTNSTQVGALFLIPKGRRFPHAMKQRYYSSSTFICL